MTQLKVTAKGQVTLKKEILRGLGVHPGEKIELELLPDGRALLKKAPLEGEIGSFIGLLANRTRKIASLEEIQEAAAQGWAGEDHG